MSTRYSRGVSKIFMDGKWVMHRSKGKLSSILVTSTLAFSLNGCATTSTLSQPIHERKPVFMSGSRLDLASLRNEADLQEIFGVTAPDYPLLDLPFSVLLDLIALGYTIPVALFYGR